MPKSQALGDLLPDEKNLNRGTARGRKVIAGSLRKSGAGRSILVDRNGRVIAGNKTLEAAPAAGIRKVRVIESDGTELIAVKRMDLDLETDDVAKALAVADNRTAELSLDWDGPRLAELSKEIDLSDMFTPRELGALTAGLVGSLGTDDAPERPDNPTSEPGALYALGPHRLLCGDSTDSAQVGEALGGVPAQMAWTDPPYNVDYTGGTGLKIQNDAMSGEAFAAFLQAAMTALSSGLVPGAPVYVAHADSWGHLFRQSFVASGLLLKETLIWAKDALVLGRWDYQWQHEPILYGFKDAEKLSADLTIDALWEHQPILYGWKPGKAHGWYSDRRQSTILSFARPKRSTVHPTMKPIALVEYCIRNSSKPGDLVLDPFGGSGTTLMAAHVNGRRAALVEKDPGYCDVIIGRWEEATQIKAERLK